jgi:hypothetical protein
MTNLTHKKIGKNQNNDNPRLGGNDPHNHPTGGNQYQDPQRGTNNNQPRQGKRTNLRTNFPCAICGEYGHYTHNFPQIHDLQWMRASMKSQDPPTPPAPQQAPQQYLQQPPSIFLQNPIPYQGVMNTQQVINPAPPQMGKHPNSGAT